MRAVLVVLAAKQRGRFIQPGGIERAEIFRQAVQLLVNVRLNQVKHAAGRKLVRLLPVIDKPVFAVLYALAGKLGRGGFQPERLVQAVSPEFGKGIPEHQIIQRQLAELLLAHHRMTVRTWYQASEDCNQYGEETVCIKGVYATPVGEDTPISTRLAQWKIVPKRAVDLAVDFKDAPASSRSSVNNCTGPQRRRLELELKARGFEGSEEEIRLLVSGCSLDAGSKMRLFYRSGRLQEDDHWHQ